MKDNFYSPTDAFVSKLGDILHYGCNVSVRGSDTKELLGQSITIHNPQQRCLVIPQRHDNIFAKIAETLWVLAGRNDIEWLSYYLPRARDWADDGKHWRAGYGPRLREWPGSKYIDQVRACHELLQADPNTRRAVISLWNPAEDNCNSLDIPCNNWLHWLIRDGKLHLFIAQRSSDILWGFSGINLFEWSVLQEFMAYSLGVGIGPITYAISSLHLYSKHYKRAESIVESYPSLTIYDGVLGSERISNVAISTPVWDMDYVLSDIFNDERKWRAGEQFHDRYGGGFLSVCAQMMHLYVMATQTKDLDAIALGINGLPSNTDFRLAAIEYFTRSHPELWPDIDLTAIEYNAFQSVFHIQNSHISIRKN